MVCEAMNDSLQGGVACLNCWKISESEHVNFDTCDKCEAFLPRLSLSSQTRPCEHCKNLSFIAARSCGSYKGAFREAILKLKISPQVPNRLITNLIEGFHRLPNAENISVIVPVPLHLERLETRGFNQAEILAKALSKALAVRTHSSCVLRQKATERHRAGMDSQKRSQLIKGAFAVRAAKIIYDKHVLLVDDVMTSGSTANELTETLLNAGAASVRILTVARANIFQ
jgi:ComF family protein